MDNTTYDYESNVKRGILKEIEKNTEVYVYAVCIEWIIDPSNPANEIVGIYDNKERANIELKKQLDITVNNYEHRKIFDEMFEYIVEDNIENKSYFSVYEKNGYTTNRTSGGIVERKLND